MQKIPLDDVVIFEEAEGGPAPTYYMIAYEFGEKE